MLNTTSFWKYVLQWNSHYSDRSDLKGWFTLKLCNFWNTIFTVVFVNKKISFTTVYRYFIFSLIFKICNSLWLTQYLNVSFCSKPLVLYHTLLWPVLKLSAKSLVYSLICFVWLNRIYNSNSDTYTSFIKKHLAMFM